MGKTIMICNQKGGVGKTTTTLELSTLYARQGKKVLAIDMDGQRTLSKFVKANLKKGTLRDVLLTLQDISEEMNSIDNINEEEFTDSKMCIRDRLRTVPTTTESLSFLSLT